jgi:hypothetical protein
LNLEGHQYRDEFVGARQDFPSLQPFLLLLDKLGLVAGGGVQGRPPITIATRRLDGP